MKPPTNHAIHKRIKLEKQKQDLISGASTANPQLPTKGVVKSATGKTWAEAEVEQLLKDKKDLKEIYQKFETGLVEMMATLTDAKKVRDTVVSELSPLSTDIDSYKQKATELGNDGLEWQMNAEATYEHISHLHYLLNHLMDKLLEEMVATSRSFLVSMESRWTEDSF